MSRSQFFLMFKCCNTFNMYFSEGIVSLAMPCWVLVFSVSLTPSRKKMEILLVIKTTL